MTYKQVFMINTDLDMGKGKIAVQIAHGEVYYMETIMNLYSFKNCTNVKMFDAWRNDEDGLMKKVVLKATEKDMNEIYQKLKDKKIWHYKVYDRGLTQVSEGSFTCIVVEPLLEEECEQLFGHLKLL